MDDEEEKMVIELSSDEEDIKRIFETKRTTNKPSNIQAINDYRRIREQQQNSWAPGTSNGFCLPQRQHFLIERKPLLHYKQLSWQEALDRRETRNHASRSDKVNYSNCGIHSDDTLNVPDENGRVLVNVDHPPEDPDIFFAPQLARALKPHQIGGIRFLYDNVVKSLKDFNTTEGQGCILAHSMGLGKTIQLCSFIDVFITDVKGRRVLCVVPVNTLQNWLSEFDMWLPTRETYRDSDPSNVRFRKFDIYQMTDVKTLDGRVNVLKKWRANGGVLLMGYELFRILTLPRKKGSEVSSKFDCNQNDQYYADDSNSSSEDIRNYLVPFKNQTNENGRKSSQKKPTQSARDIINETLLDPGADLIVCDEGHRIKNAKTGISIALKQIATKRRIVLTGYPLQNNLIEYWCMVDFVKPNYLGTQRDFTVLFEKPITAGQCVDSDASHKRIMRYRAHVLHKILEQFVQRRSHSLLKNQLPRKHEHVILIRMTHIQRALIRGFIEQIKTADLRTKDNRLRVNALLLFAICCKIWNHPDIINAVVKDGGQSDIDLAEMQQMMSDDHLTSNSRQAKMLLDTNNCSKAIPYEWAEDVLLDYETGHIENSYKVVLFFFILEQTLKVRDRILLFSQSLLTLDLIEEFLSIQAVPHSGTNQKWRRDVNYYRIDGSSTPYERERYIESFNKDPQYKLFLISTRAGSLGINLTGANRIVIFDASWNPCHDAQAACRVFRYGQKKECYIYRFVCDNTLEKRIYDRQINKQGMANRVVDQLNHESRLTWQEITQLVLDFDGTSDPPPVKMTPQELQEISDPLVRDICQHYRHTISAPPFEHESLLLDHEETKLTENEKKIAVESFKKAPMNPDAAINGENVSSSHMTGFLPANYFAPNMLATVNPDGYMSGITQGGHVIPVFNPSAFVKIDPVQINEAKLAKTEPPRPRPNVEPEVIDISD